MGLSCNSIKVLEWCKVNGYVNKGDCVLEMGAQQINNDLIENIGLLDIIADRFKVEPFSKMFNWVIKEKKVLDSGMQHLPEDAPYAKEVYEHLGLKYVCVDFDETPHTLKMDLNFDSVPKDHNGKYIFVTNFGTTEHVTDQLNAFKVIHDFTSHNGIMVHTLPFQGFASHGFFSYTMQFFWMLCRSNMYKVIDVDVTSWGSVPIAQNIVNFAKENSMIFKNKDHIDKLNLQDTGIEIVLQKSHDIDFVPPIDVLNGTMTNDPVMKKRYWTVFDQDSLNMYLLKGKKALHNLFENKLTVQNGFKQ